MPDRDLPPALLRGVSSGCPFCLSVHAPLPSPGEQFTFLANFHCGTTARMIEIQSSDGGRFTYAIDGEPFHHSYIGNRGHEDILALDLFSIPAWAPPLAVEDAHRVHWSFMTEFVRAPFEQRSPNHDDALIGLVGCLWSWRLPLAFDDLWPMLLAHGWPASAYAVGKAKLDFALEAIRSSAGRRPIQRRRLPAFDTWRYEPRRRAKSVGDVGV